ncbi:hypothetical protein B6N60_05064 [Richelia sinica FACHB-800]|uniref:Uncharacterized protein n=1 Tax=Richelia sinica FACHB-800 TaxID=1357546 RepID=A0A975TDW8_9NOST|nr:hypothetical protein [Richelia sinica]MBD2663939.1 hypothetical protein [Richelia sinica FACHB-800]QXE26333.1 hypothetical protein B6N60_05064 [Richelia sinica FACHB-800]
MSAGSKNLQNLHVKTRLLLALWDLGGVQQEVKKGQISKRIVAKGEKIGDYQRIFEELEKEGVIAISKTGYTLTSPTGLEVLGASLGNEEFKFDKNVGAWIGNSLLRWLRQTEILVTASAASGNGTKPGLISSYEEFKNVALKVYEKLNYEYNFNHLVPIYRLRRTIGERVNRTNFNDWLLEMQADDIFQLQGGSIEDSAPDKIEDSVTTELDGLRCYAKLLNV